MQDPPHRANLDWKGQYYPNPDFLSSSRKRLVPQMLSKGGILKKWKKKQAIALQSSFFETLPTLREVNRDEADIAWILYDLQLDSRKKEFDLVHTKTVYTEFEPAITQISTLQPGNINDFIGLLQDKLDEKLEGNPPDAPILTDNSLV
jgi:hypothetical protein